MSRLDGVLHRLRVLLRPREHERELAEELDFHMGLEQMQQEHARVPRDDAQRTARRLLGNVTYYQEETRRAAGLGFLDDIQSDVRFALRTFRRDPGFTTVAVLTLAVGIGLNTAIFSAVNALLLRPLPLPEPERLMLLSITAPPYGANPERSNIAWSYPKFTALRDAQTSFSDVTAWLSTQFTVRVGDDAERESGEFIDSRYFPTLGLTPALGRNFLAEEDYLGGPRIALVSHAMWERVFNADSAVLGRTMSVDGAPYTIVGVMPEGVSGLSGDASFWIPAGAAPTALWQTEITRDAWNHRYLVLGRLRPGVSVERARAAMQELGTMVDARFPAPPSLPGLHLGATAHPLDAARVNGDMRRTLFVLVGAVGLVLLIACANVANLFLLRATGRRREIAVRLAIGAGRGRLVRQLVVESTVLAAAGGVASLIVAWWGVKSLSSLEITSVLRLQNLLGLGSTSATGIRLDMTAFAFTGALAIATGLIFGLVPAIQSTDLSVTTTLKDDGGDTGSGVRRFTSRNALVVLEIALAIVLLAGSGLMLRSLGQLLAVKPGFNAEHLLTLRVNRAPDWSRDSIARFYDAAVARLSAIPGVESVAIGDCPPLSRGCYARTGLGLPDRPPVAAAATPIVGVHWITPSWPKVVGVSLVRGRLFTRADDARSRKVVLVSESAARKIWPGEDPIDRPVLLGVDYFEHDTAYVAGVIADLRFGSIDSLPQPDVYISYYQSPFTYRMMLFVRTRGDPLAVAGAARKALREISPGFPIYDVQSMQTRVAEGTAQARFSAVLLGIFAAMALMLAAIGTYGVISFAVAQRTREIGVRVALGATTRDVVRLVVGQGMRLATIGIVFGLTAAIATTRVLRSLLYGVEPTDPTTLFGIVAMLMLAVTAASWIPARRAALVPAVQALRGR
jgi:predicted permease